ncbi:uncharacterized protein L203_102495 [Cryptococcus depauperatus CBS 7841]|uniref:Putative zinc-finger domain-containing protein n=1 Tax=Cryptococcus depauperatus CBS 7841 TaxID=1295531 RepID=A0AAJ8M182_9TREE
MVGRPGEVETTARAQLLSPPSSLVTSQPQTPATTFSIYRPFLPQYPQLLHAVLDSTFQTINPATGPSTVLSETSDTLSSLDYNLLRSIVLTNRSQTNPDVVLCRAETSGGVCADKNCQDLHIAKGFTPSDTDLVEYILKARLISQDSTLANDEQTREKVTSMVQIAKRALALQNSSEPNAHSPESKSTEYVLNLLEKIKQII